MCADEIVVGRLPGFVSPGDALHESCHLQLVVDSAANTVLQFFHSSVPLPWGVVKAFCRGGSVKVLNYKIATNSDLVKRGCLVMLSKIKGEQWLTQALQEKLRRPPKNGDMVGNASGGSWDVTPDELREGIAYINKNAPVANSNNEQFLWSLLNVRDKESPIFGWPLHIVSRACSNRSLGNSQAEAEHFFPLLVPGLNPNHGQGPAARCPYYAHAWLDDSWQSRDWQNSSCHHRGLSRCQTPPDISQHQKSWWDGTDPSRSTDFGSAQVNYTFPLSWMTLSFLLYHSRTSSPSWTWVRHV